MKRSLTPESLQSFGCQAPRTPPRFRATLSGAGKRRQPVHTVYAGAQLFHADSAQRLGAYALQSLDDYAPDFVTFAKAIGLDGASELPDAPEEIERLEKYIDSDPDTFRKESRAAWLALTIYPPRARKTGPRAGRGFSHRFRRWLRQSSRTRKKTRTRFRPRCDLAAGAKAGTLPPFIGIRIKPFNEELRARSIRTLDLFVTAMAEACAGRCRGIFTSRSRK